jgi:hypothetical protein
MGYIYVKQQEQLKSNNEYFRFLAILPLVFAAIIISANITVLQAPASLRLLENSYIFNPSARPLVEWWVSPMQRLHQHRSTTRKVLIHIHASRGI